ILQQQVFEFSRRLRTAEVESRSLHMQLEELKLAFNEMKKEAEKAHRLQEELNALQHVSVFDRMMTQGNIEEQLNNALRREQEARLLVQEHEQRLQELSNRLEMQPSEDTDRSRDLKAPLLSLSEAAEELRRRDRVLNHQKRLLKHMEQDRQRLQANAQEAERALQVAARDKELIINYMRDVEATLKEVRF
ncbi:CC171 protein, partial [Dasyornis broadbenti]|nr:CC171 protein [Dasyornis broadbenti]